MPSHFEGEIGTIYLRRIPRALRDCFKAACARRGKSMTKTIIAFMKEVVKNDNKLDLRPKRGRPPRSRGY